MDLAARLARAALDVGGSVATRLLLIGSAYAAIVPHCETARDLAMIAAAACIAYMT